MELKIRRFNLKHQISCGMLTDELRKELEKQLINSQNVKVVIMSQEAIAYKVKSKIEVIFYHEIIAVKKEAGKVLLYGKEGVLGTIPETKEYPVDFILHELKNKNPKIKRIRGRKKKDKKNFLENFYAKLNKRQSEIFYMIYVLSDWIIWLILQLAIVFISTYGVYGKEVVFLLMIVTFIGNTYLCRKAYYKFKVWTLGSLYYGMFVIKLLLFGCSLYILSL